MTTTKRGHAINGDLFTLRHTPTSGPAFSLTPPFTSFIDVAFRGTTHQVLAAADNRAFNYAHTTGEFSVGKLRGHIVETLDTVQTQAVHRYQAIVATATGALSIHSHISVESLLSLVGSLRPAETNLGVVLHPDDNVEFTAAPRVAIQLDIGVVEVTPLTAEVIDELPDWEGTPVQGGQLYGGRFVDSRPYLTLVTDTCRVMAMPGDVDPDRVTQVLAGLEADWKA